KTLGMTPLNTPLLPIQLIEALLLMILFSVLMFFYFKMRKSGLITATYLYAYSVIRFVLEFFRGDKERGLIFGFSTSQIVSIVIVVFVTILLIVKIKKKAVN
ncbi:MAG: prolipoprotein diacylglyceryl transferase, partial [Clostridia bacterium]|nr:prolipoprotein diacylglyceryl transferase [Clostridia bacterium]